MEDRDHQDDLERVRGTRNEPQDDGSEESVDGEPGEAQGDGSPTPSPATQIGRAEQTGGTPASGLEAGIESREGWPMPDQSDTPEEWPEPTID